MVNLMQTKVIDLKIVAGNLSNHISHDNNASLYMPLFDVV